MFGVALAALIGVSSCGYDPNPASGEVKCGPSNSCPDNYTCMSGACWRNGGAGTTGRGGSGNPGSGGRAGSGGSTAGSAGSGGSGGSSQADKFIGRWTSDKNTAKRVRVCTDGTNEIIAWDDFMDIAAGTTTALTTMYYCDWNLDLAATGNATMIRTGATCTHPDPNDATIMYAWRGETLTLTSTDGKNGTIDMSLPYSYTTSMSSGSCTMHFTGPMSKN
jgi:hypothetical protein